jgi:hypothetical protein
MTLFGRRVTLDWWSVILAAVVAFFVVVGWVRVPW